jgi:hypothetical protein
MIEVPIAAVPNQTLSIQLDQNNYDIEIYTTNRANANLTGDGVMGITISRNGVLIISGFRLVANYLLIPYEYLEDGNFVLITQNDEYPDYPQFGVTQNLIYASQAELGVIRAGT